LTLKEAQSKRESKEQDREKRNDATRRPFPLRADKSGVIKLIDAFAEPTLCALRLTRNVSIVSAKENRHKRLQGQQGAYVVVTVVVETKEALARQTFDSTCRVRGVDIFTNRSVLSKRNESKILMLAKHG